MERWTTLQVDGRPEKQSWFYIQTDKKFRLGKLENRVSTFSRILRRWHRRHRRRRHSRRRLTLQRYVSDDLCTIKRSYVRFCAMALVRVFVDMIGSADIEIGGDAGIIVAPAKSSWWNGWYRMYNEINLLPKPVTVIGGWSSTSSLRLQLSRDGSDSSKLLTVLGSQASSI